MAPTAKTGPALGVTGEGKLSPCPRSPNCVCSDADDSVHAIAPLSISGDPLAAWDALVTHVESERAYTIVAREPNYLRAEARTRWLKFVDDVEFHLRPERNQIAMRSASRIGYSDLGANRRRLEAVRKALADGLGAPHEPPPTGPAR